MKIVGVVACTMGIAHTYMAQEALEVECRKRGYEAKIETQGGMGIENELSEEDIEGADFVIMATAIGIEMPERFEAMENKGLMIQLDPSVVIRDPKKLIDEIEEKLK